MTEDLMKQIFGVEDEIKLGMASISVEKFLYTLGFADCEPTKASMLAHDGGKMGYADFIKNGNWGSPE